MATNAVSAFLQLKRVCGGIESDSQKLKATVSGGVSERTAAPIYVGTAQETEAFANRLEEKVDSARSQLNLLETALFGSAEKRLSQVTLAEVYEKLKNLHSANGKVLAKVEQKLCKYGYECVQRDVAQYNEEEDKENSQPNGEQQRQIDDGYVPSSDENKDINNEDEERARSGDNIVSDGDGYGEGGGGEEEEADGDIDHDHESSSSFVEDEEQEQGRESIGFPKSPVASRTSLAGGTLTPSNNGENGDLPKTPLLPDWKLSEATRNLVQISKTGAGTGTDTSIADRYTTKQQQQLQQQQQSSESYSCYHAAPPNNNTGGRTVTDNAGGGGYSMGSPGDSPNGMNISGISISQSFDMSNRGRMSVLAPNEAELLTPEVKKNNRGTHHHTAASTARDNDAHARNKATSSADCTPETPKIGTPFHTCNLRSTAVSSNQMGMGGIVKKLSDTIGNNEDADDDIIGSYNDYNDNSDDAPPAAAYSQQQPPAYLGGGFPDHPPADAIAPYINSGAAAEEEEGEDYEEQPEGVVAAADGDEPSIMDPPENLFSPPKTSKLLQPRRGGGIVVATTTSTTTTSSSVATTTASVAGVSGSIAAANIKKQGNKLAAAAGSAVIPPIAAAVLDVSDRESVSIPAITSEEWAGAPSFLRLQVSSDALNTALERINRYMKEQKALTQTQPVSFTQIELDDMLTNKKKSDDDNSSSDASTIGAPLNVKAITLGMVHLKRLDLGTENGVKVFKVRRFY